ncbi:MAG: hypothetical protein ACLRXC_04770 [[Clostridium] leptum]
MASCGCVFSKKGIILISLQRKGDFRQFYFSAYYKVLLGEDRGNVSGYDGHRFLNHGPEVSAAMGTAQAAPEFQADFIENLVSPAVMAAMGSI